MGSQPSSRKPSYPGNLADTEQGVASGMVLTPAVRQLLAPTSLPRDFVDEVLGQASATWLMGQSSESVAGELVLCHPPLGSGEIRAVAKPTFNPEAWRLTVVAHDRPGLLADMTAVLADLRLSVTSAAVTVLPGLGLALQRVTSVQADGRSMVADDWDAVGGRLQAVLGRQEQAPRPTFVPAGPVVVEAHPQDAGRALVSVRAPDRIGLLWAVTSWFAQHGCNVEACQATSSDGIACDEFLIVGADNYDCADLATAIGGGRVKGPNLPAPFNVAIRAGVIAGAVAGAIVVRAVRTMRRSS